jgi:hypothetical protein
LLTTEIDKKIKELWDDPDRTRIWTIRKLVQTTVNDVLRAPLTMKQHWVTRVEMALKRYKANQDAFKFASEREQMRRYLTSRK